MKKTILIILTLLPAIVSLAQTPRCILIEDFTSASSNAAYWSAPGIEDIQDLYSDNIISIQYHTSFPVADTMNILNPGEVLSRTSLYNFSAVPRLVLDGNVFSGQPDNLPYSTIDSRILVNSPFQINVSHQFSLNNDSVLVTVVIKATQAVNGNFTAYIAATERNIYFTNAPGTSPQTKFNHVFKKMLPDDAGTLLTSNWNVNDSVVLSEGWLLNGVYKPEQLEMVCWVQDLTSKEVLQASVSKAKIPLDIGVVKTEFNDVLFPGSFFPKARVKNLGTDVLTSCTISLKVGSGPDSTKQWTGSIDPGQTGIINLTEIIAVPGNYTFLSAAQIPNGGIDLDPMNDSGYYNFSVVDTVLAPPLFEDFEGNVFPPPHWFVSNKNNDITFLQDVYGAFGSSTKSARMPFFTGTRFRTDELYLPALNLTGIANPVQLKFDYAYTYFDNTSSQRYDTLSLMISSDSGNTWAQVWSAGGIDLATAPGNNSSFFPANNEWKTDSVDLSAFSGLNPLLVKFSGNSGRGNNLFIDNIAVDVLTGINQPGNNVNFEINPNPSNGLLTFTFPLNGSQIADFKISNLQGKVLYSRLFDKKDAQRHNIDISFLVNGIYFATWTDSGKTQIRKLVVLH